MGSADAASGDDRPEELPPLPDEAEGVTLSLRRFCPLFPEAPDDPASRGADKRASRSSDDPALPGSEEDGSED